MNYLPFLFFGVFFLITGGLIFYAIIADRKRTAAMAQAAEELGFEFDPTSRDTLPDDLAELYLFTQGSRRRARNVMRGKTSDLDVTIFDYTYTVGTGKNKSSFTQTVVCFRTGNLRLPIFSLRPENIWHRIGTMFGMKDIDFESHPKFSKSYLLKGPEEVAVRHTFTESVLDFFEDRPGLCVEADSRVLVFYRQNKRVDPTAIRDFLAEGFEVLTAIRDGSA